MREGMRWLRICVLGLLAASLVGCGSGRSGGEFAEYPGLGGGDEQLNVQAFRRGTTLELTNTSTVAFGESRLWANRAYSRGIVGIGIGETIRVSLHDFRNEYGQPFEAGGFFATARPDALVSLEIEREGVMHRVMVVEDTIE